jgi:uncharacterized protein YbjT (DUF2867 family)
MTGADILVSGATGRTGGAAIGELLEMGKRVRAYVRSDDGRAAALRKRGVDIAVGDFTDIDDIRAAMEGIRSADGRHAPIASDDQGRVIAHLLAHPQGHERKIYTLHGPVEMNHSEIAAAMGEALGTAIEYAPTSIEVFKEKMANVYKFPAFMAQHLVEVAQNYRDGIFSGTNDAVEKITGTPPLSVPQFIARNRAAFA